MRPAALLNAWLNLEGSARDNGRGWATTAEEVVAGKSLAGRNFVVTGANTGLLARRPQPPYAVPEAACGACGAAAGWIGARDQLQAITKARRGIAGSIAPTGLAKHLPLQSSVACGVFLLC